MGLPRRAVYYALDQHPRTVFQLRRSVESVRRYAPHVPIYVVVAGTLSIADRAFLDAAEVSVVPGALERGMAVTFMKWRALTHLPPCAELLYLDTDTLAFADPTRLFDLAGAEDFHARLEAGCERERSAYPYLFNVELLISSQVDHELLALITDLLGARALPVFNSGVMLFRNRFAERLAAQWPEFLHLERRFRRHQLPYPCTNSQLFDEIVACIVLGTFEPFTWSHISRDWCPWYPEYRGRDVHSPGIVLHALSWCYNSCAFEFCGKEVALAYAELPPHGRTRVHRTRADRTHGRTGLTTTEHKELARLRKENRELQTERNILRRAAAFFAKRRS